MFSNRVQPSELSPGDHVCVRRMGMVYSHHGIYSGEGRVIHYTDVEGLLNKRFSKIVETPLEDFLGSGVLRRRKYLMSDDTNKILERARAAMHQQSYHLVFNNCEHFATWCTTGRKQSQQVLRATVAVVSAVTVVAGAMLSRGGRRPGI